MAFSEQLLVKLGLNTTGFKSSLVGVEKRTSKFASGMKAKLAGALSFGALVAFTKRTHEFVNTLGNTADKLGVNVVQLQRLHSAFEDTGVSVETGNMALQRFIRRIGEAQNGTGTFKDVLKDYGIELKDAEGKQRNVIDIFHDYADAIQGIGNPTERARVLFAGLDSEGVQLAQTLRFGSEGLKQMGDEAERTGRVLKQSTITKFQEADAQIEKANRQLKVMWADMLPKVIVLWIKFKLGMRAIIFGLKVIGTLIAEVAKAITNDLIKRFDVALNKMKAGITKLQIAWEKVSFSPDLTKIKALEAELKQFTDKAKKAQSELDAMSLKKNLREALEPLDEEHDQIQKDMVAAAKEIRNLEKTTSSAKNETDELANAFKRIDTNAKGVTDEVTKTTIQLQRQNERIEALRQGGKKLLDQVVDRHAMEDAVAQLMKDGNMTKEEARKLVEKRFVLEKQEKDLLAGINVIEGDRLALIKKHGLERVQALADERKRGRAIAEANVELNKELAILQARANGNDQLVAKLEEEKAMREQINDVVEDMKIPEENAIKHLEKKLDLEKQIALQKVQQNANNERQAREDMKDNLGGMRKAQMDDEEKEQAKELRRLEGFERALEEARKLRKKGAVDTLEKKIEDQRKKLFGDAIKEDEKAKADARKERKEIKLRHKAQQDALKKINDENKKILAEAKEQKKVQEDIKKQEKELAKKIKDVERAIHNKKFGITVWDPEGIFGEPEVFIPPPPPVGDSMPKAPKVKVDVDTKNLGKEQTLVEIRDELKGKFKNE
jgi:hypothetical protein